MTGKLTGRSRAYMLIVGLVPLAACGPEDELGDVSTFNFGAALSDFYLSEYSPALLAQAANLRNTDPRYTSQEFSWSFPSGPVYNSYFLSNANVEYAHAAGLTGAGQIISIIDAGFLTSHDEFVGKTIYMPGGSLPVNDHGTSVASVAAGSASNGMMIGVAPAADLALGSYATFAEMTAATDQATALGAIVQNNSWGYDGYAATMSNYNSFFGSGAGATYMASLKTFAENSVVVFAASNKQGNVSTDIMAGLPLIQPELEESWIAAVNAVPNVVGEQIVSAQLLSSGCREAAPWCITADGTADAAIATDNSDYGISTGSSFAAPQVAGAVALLAEAFPDHTAQELRARILASADNGFYDHTGYVEFAPGVDHGFDQEFGHGFLDLRAALLPIGGSYVPTSNGARSLDGPVVLSGGMVGDGLSTRLAKHDMMIVDGLGGGFQMPADILTATAVAKTDPYGIIVDLMATDLNGDLIDPFNTQATFSKFVSGQEMNVAIEDRHFTLLLPSQSSPDTSFGLSMAQEFDLGGSTLALGLAAMHESDGFVGMKGLSDTSSIKADHAKVSFDWGIPLDSRQELRLAGSIGMAVPDASLTAVTMNPVQYNEIRLSYGASDVWGKGDRFSFALNLPQAVYAGSAAVELPTSMTRSVASFETVDVSLAPTARQMDLSISYGVPLSKRSELVMSATHSVNDGNIADRSNGVVAIGYRFQF